jgi:hypothetical protein
MKQKHPNEVVLIETMFETLLGEAQELSEDHVQALKLQKRRQQMKNDDLVLTEENGQG